MVFFKGTLLTSSPYHGLERWSRGTGISLAFFSLHTIVNGEVVVP